MVALSTSHDDGVTFDELILVQRHRLLVLEDTAVLGVAALDEFHDITVLVLELEDMRSLLHDGIFHFMGTLQIQRVLNNLEIHGLDALVGVIDGIALGAEDYILIVLIDPYTLKHLLGLDILGTLVLCRLMAARAYQQSGHEEI